ncbi:MAG: formate dehydrogenase accessory sulfurtransferase FdhD [Anaerolineaceae bacterium]
MTDPYQQKDIWQYARAAGKLEPARKPIVSEHAAALYVNDEHWLTFICTPTDLDALALGFLYGEYVIKDKAEIHSLTLEDGGSRIMVRLNHTAQKPAQFHRTSTGYALDSKPKAPQLPTDFRVRPSEVLDLFRQFLDQQELHEHVGGFHSAGLSDGVSVPIMVEDLGRHNCVDKLTGLFLLRERPFTPNLLLLSGRISSEMVFKTFALGVPVIVSRTSPTALAVDCAWEAGITLIGYLRGAQFDVYSHPERLLV